MKNKNTDTSMLVLCGLFTALIAAGAFIQVPVPYMDYFTLQFFFVLSAGLLLGAKYGSIAVGVYVLLGLLGVPIFAAGGGIGYIFRPSFGYLIGFIGAAFVAGMIRERTANTWRNRFLACLSGLVITYGIGLMYKYMILNYYTGTPTTFWVVLAACFPLDLPADLALCFLSASVSKRFQKFVRK